MDSDYSPFRLLAGTALGLLPAWFLYYSSKSKRNHDESLAKSLAKRFGLDGDRVECAGVVSGLWLYPIKTCRGWQLERALCSQYGLQDPTSGIFDRFFAVYHPATGNMISLMDKPSLASVSASVVTINRSSKTNTTANTTTCQIMRVSAPSMAFLDIPLDENSLKKISRGSIQLKNKVPTDALDCGEAAANWFTRYLKSADQFSLIYFADEFEKRKCLDDSSKHDIIRSKLNESDVSGFANWSPYMLMTDGSVEVINGHLSAGVSVSIRNFRPNLTVAGSPPFDEDEWDYIIVGGSVLFRNVKPCTRCPVTLANPESGIFNANKEPLTTLRKFRVLKSDDRIPLTDAEISGKKPVVGGQLTIQATGPVQVGDSVFVIRHRK